MAVERAGLTGIPSGSHVLPLVLLATSMLREGSTLEAIGTTKACEAGYDRDLCEG